MVWHGSLSVIFRSFKSAPTWLSTYSRKHSSPRSFLQHFGSHIKTHGCSTNPIHFSSHRSPFSALLRYLDPSVGLFLIQERMSVYSLLNSNESTSRNRNRDGRITINSLLSRPGEERNKATSSSATDRNTASLDHRSSMINRHTSMYVARNNNTTRTALPSIASLRQSFHENNPARTGQSRQDRLSNRDVLTQVSHTPKSNRSSFNTKPYDGPELHKVGRTISVPHNNFASNATTNLAESPGDSSSPTLPNSASHNALTFDQGSNRQVANPPRRRWKEWEDEKLTRLVNDMGPHHWNSIAEHFPGRNGRQVRLRWMNHLQPSLDKRPWRDDEDSVLLAAHAELGNKWALIAMRLNGRTDNSVKNRYKSITRKASRASAPTTGINRWRRPTRSNALYSFSKEIEGYSVGNCLIPNIFCYLLGPYHRSITWREE